MIRKHSLGFVASALALAVSAQAFAGTVTTDGADIVIKTKGGLEVATTDKEFSFKLGGRLQADYSRFDGFYTKNGNTADAAYFRRAFIELGGTAYKDWKYQINFDLSHNTGSSDNGYFDEASVTYTGFNPVNLKFGRFDPDFGLEKATSSKWVTAPERNAAYELADWINTHQDGMGAQVNSTLADMAYLSAGVSAKDADDSDGDSVKQFNFRGVFAPMHEAGNVLHVGVNYAYRDLDDTAFDSRIRPRLGMRGIATSGGNDAGDNGNRATFGGVSNSPAGSYKDIKAKGYYAQLAYTLTGESRQYKLEGAKFDSVKPENKEIGAWEVFYRYDNIKVEDDNVVADTATREVGDTKAKAHNLGVNWYVNDAVKISAAYVKAKTDKITNNNGDDDGDGFVTRLQYVF